MSFMIMMIAIALLLSCALVFSGLTLYRLLLVRFPSKNEKSDDIITYPMV
jgi:hypothetical protein